VAAVFQDFLRLELPLRDNVAPAGAPDDVVLAALAEAGASGLADLDTVLARGYEGGTDLSGGQWQRVALARALCAVQLGAGVVCAGRRRSSTGSWSPPGAARPS
jgi:ABC-type multidrug transport system fused ATPase/permease subunit